MRESLRRNCFWKYDDGWRSDMNGFHIVLMRPEIPQNVGNIIRLSVNCHCALHIIRPLGFIWDEKKIKRAAMDYWEQAVIQLHADFPSYLRAERPASVYAFTSKTGRLWTEVSYCREAALLFGRESSGLPWDELEKESNRIEKVTIPTAFPGRSLNVANAVAIATYEVWRQNGFVV